MRRCNTYFFSALPYVIVSSRFARSSLDESFASPDTKGETGSKK